MRYLVNGYGAYFGGIVRVHNAVCNELAQRGELAIASAPRSQVIAGEARILSRQADSRWRSFMLDVRAALKFERFDVRIDSAPGFRFMTPARKHIAIVHDLNFLYPQVHGISWKQRAYRWLLHRWTLRRVDRIIVNSSSTLNELATFMPRAAEKAKVLPLPVDHLTLDPLARPRAPVDVGMVNLLAFGHALNKGLDRLFRLLAENRRFSLTVICPAVLWDRYWADAASELGVAGRVRVVSDLSDEDLLGEYRAADVFCMLSTYEGYGIPVAEAISLGVPTVVSNLPVLSETSRNRAVVATEFDPKHLERAIMTALTLPGDHWLAASRAVTSWSWSDWVDSMLDGIA